jgi:hypothetical protein
MHYSFGIIPVQPTPVGLYSPLLICTSERIDNGTSLSLELRWWSTLRALQRRSIHNASRRAQACVKPIGWRQVGHACMKRFKKLVSTSISIDIRLYVEMAWIHYSYVPGFPSRILTLGVLAEVIGVYITGALAPPRGLWLCYRGIGAVEGRPFRLWKFVMR